MFISDYFGLEYELDLKGVFDSILDKDSHYFINLLRLKSAKTPEFSKSYERINNYFSGIATLLSLANSKSRGDRFYREALRKFRFSELNGINLGFSETQYGAGFGEGLRNRVIADSFDIIKAGSKQPEIFQLVGLFEENVGPDRLSDMIGTIIKPDIIAYTKRILCELNITPSTHPELAFYGGLVLNPHKNNCPILLLPVEILHELPIARCWDEIDRVVAENEVVRQEFNEAIGTQWSKWATGQKKAYIKEHIFKNPERCSRVIDGYRNSKTDAVDLLADIDYYVAQLWRRIQLSGSLPGIECDEPINSMLAALSVVNQFKDWVENNRGWDVILLVPSSKREKVVQRLVHLAAKEYISSNNLDISFEPDEGRGPVDFKVSRGGDKTIVEIKLSSNTQYLHGYEEQIKEYGKAERTDNLIYVFLDVGNPGRKKTIEKMHAANIAAKKSVPELIIIDSTQKDSASTFTTKPV